LREYERAFRDKGAALAAVGLGDLRYAKAFCEETGITFPLLVDEHRKAYRAAELRRTIFSSIATDNAIAQPGKSAGHRQHKPGAKSFPARWSFVRPRDVDRFAHISKTFGDNASPADLLAALP
jgi:hypothetical protein